MGKVYASATTWWRMIRKRGWGRPRRRVYPAKPKVGIRATQPDEIWHVDLTVIKVLDGTKVYLHAVSARSPPIVVTDSGSENVSGQSTH